MKAIDIIRRCEALGIGLLTDGERVGLRGRVPPELKEAIRAHKREVIDYLRPKPSPPLPAWAVTDKNLRSVVPGPPERQDFRRKVVELAGSFWHACPVTIRESIISRHLPARDHLAAATEIMRFMGRGA